MSKALGKTMAEVDAVESQCNVANTAGKCPLCNRDMFWGVSDSGHIELAIAVPVCSCGYRVNSKDSVENEVIKLRTERDQLKAECNKWEMIAESYRIHGNKACADRDALITAIGAAVELHSEFCHFVAEQVPVTDEAIRSKILKLRQDLAEVLAALEMAISWLDEYSKMHHDKGDFEKSATNLAKANKLRVTLLKFKGTL